MQVAMRYRVEIRHVDETVFLQTLPVRGPRQDDLFAGGRVCRRRRGGRGGLSLVETAGRQ
jgi:hypothetical protein